MAGRTLESCPFFYPRWQRVQTAGVKSWHSSSTRGKTEISEDCSIFRSLENSSYLFFSPSIQFHRDFRSNRFFLSFFFLFSSFSPPFFPPFISPRNISQSSHNPRFHPGLRASSLSIPAHRKEKRLWDREKRVKSKKIGARKRGKEEGGWWPWARCNLALRGKRHQDR